MSMNPGGGDGEVDRVVGGAAATKAVLTTITFFLFALTIFYTFSGTLFADYSCYLEGGSKLGSTPFT